ncbi:MAG: LysM peptidoglycan-binding domain-containing protein [Planctomycetaceae bacterium]
MHRDHKLGLALGVLVLGFAAAFCFPKQTDVDQRLLQLESAAELDADIDELPVHAYTNSDPVPPTAAEPAIAAASVLAEPAIIPGSDGTFDLAAGPPAPIAVATPATQVPESVTIGSSSAAPAEIAAAADVMLPDERDEQLVEHYTVRSGDTLSSLAAHFLGNSVRYLELFEANREILATPDDLQPGMVLIVPVREHASSQSTNDRAQTTSAADATAASEPTSARGDVKTAPHATEEPPRRFQRAGQRPFLKTQPASSERTLQLPMMNASAAKSGEEERAADGAGRTYTVRRGDTLEGIAVREYGDVRAVEKLRKANRNVVGDPRRLKPGTTLTLPEK